jgi:hypothetical protein
MFCAYIGGDIKFLEKSFGQQFQLFHQLHISTYIYHIFNGKRGQKFKHNLIIWKAKTSAQNKDNWQKVWVNAML